MPDAVLFYGFLAVFALYFYGVQHAWKLMRLIVPLHQRETVDRLGDVKAKNPVTIASCFLKLRIGCREPYAFERLVGGLAV